jgi:anti-sigma B factor antagonist
LKYLRLVGPSPVGDSVSTSTHVRVYRVGHWSVVAIDGELDMQSVPAVRSLLTGEGPLIVFDLELLTFMDCRGLGLLAGTAGSASKYGGCVRVASASRRVRKLVSLSSVDRVVSLFDSLEDALTVPAASGTEPAP